MDAKPVTVMLVNVGPLLRDLVGQLLRAGTHVVSGDPVGTDVNVQHAPPDAVLVGLDASESLAPCEEILHQYPGTRVIALSITQGRAYICTHAIPPRRLDDVSLQTLLELIESGAPDRAATPPSGRSI